MYYVYQDRQVQLAIYLKAQKFQREFDLPFSTKNILSYLRNVLWQENLPKSLSNAIDDILKITASELYDYLAEVVIAQAKHQTLAEFQDYLKKQ